MVHKYYFKSPYSDFQGPLVRTACHAVSQNGKPCRRHAVIDCYCFQHLPLEKHIRIGPSTISNAGLGVFAWWIGPCRTQPVFVPGAEICYYGGEAINQTELDQRYTQDAAALGEYVIKCRHHWYIDAARYRSAGAMVNDGRDGAVNNAMFHTRRVRPWEMDTNGMPKVSGAYPTHRKTWRVIVVRAIKPIYHDDEIFVSYGTGYWQDPTFFFI